MINIMDSKTGEYLLNTFTDIMMTYYSKRQKSFVVFTEDEKVPSDCVEVPFVEEIECCARRLFWKRLGFNEMNCPHERRFHSYIRRHEIDVEYYEFESSIILPYMKAWAKDNDITFDWDNRIVV